MKLDALTIAALNKVPSALADNVGRLTPVQKATQDAKLFMFTPGHPAYEARVRATERAAR